MQIHASERTCSPCPQLRTEQVLAQDVHKDSHGPVPRGRCHCSGRTRAIKYLGPKSLDNLLHAHVHCSITYSRQDTSQVSIDG